MSVFRELVVAGNRFRNTPIVDDDFPAVRDEFDALLARATEELGLDARCPFVLAGGDQHGHPIQGGQCLLRAGHKGACTNGKSTWTDRSNW